MFSQIFTAHRNTLIWVFSFFLFFPVPYDGSFISSCVMTWLISQVTVCFCRSWTVTERRWISLACHFVLLCPLTCTAWWSSSLAYRVYIGLHNLPFKATLRKMTSVMRKWASLGIRSPVLAFSLTLIYVIWASNALVVVGMEMPS